MSIWSSTSKAGQEALYAEQEMLEMHALNEGIAHYREQRHRQDRSSGRPEQILIAEALRTLTPAVAELQRHVASGGAARGVTRWGVPFISLPADKLAFLALAEAVNLADQGANSATITVASAIGGRVKIEREFARMKEEARNVFNFIRRHRKRWSRAVHRTAMTKAQLVDDDWSNQTRIWLGMVLLELAVKNTSLFEIKRSTIRGKTSLRVNLSPEVRATLEKSHGECELLRPFHLPMVVPPREWGDQRNGGYIFHRVPLVKPCHGGGDVTERDHDDMPTVLRACNVIQATEWRINRPVYEVQRTVWEAGGGWAGIPTAEPLPLPEITFDWDAAPVEQRAEWKARATRVHDENARRSSQRKAMLHKLWIARKVLDREVIYFPGQLDWRGRWYPLPVHLHPQGDDAARGLLEFAEGKELGERGLYWLKVHLANCYGVDDVPFRERVAWVEASLARGDVRHSAENPLDYRWWAEGEKPWQILAACMALSGAERSTHCRLPVQMDGSCNGLQHLSAMGRDEVGGSAVNLVPSDRPQDVYSAVADEVRRLVERDLTCDDLYPRRPNECDVQPPKDLRGRTERCAGSTGTPTPSPSTSTSTGSKATEARPAYSEPLKNYARRWLPKITRKLVKRATMTIFYGLTKAGMSRQYVEDGWCDDLDGSLALNARYIRDRTWTGLEGTLDKAARVMTWLQDTAQTASNAGIGLRWETPTGFLVIQEYVEQRKRTITTAMQRLTIVENKENGNVLGPRQVRGIVPNFVHSYDAAHMMLTALNAKERDITHFSMVHDSYGTHACDIDELRAALREEFVQMYAEPILPRLHRGWGIVIGTELPPLPPLGNLNISSIQQSEYMFN